MVSLIYGATHLEESMKLADLDLTTDHDKVSSSGPMLSSQLCGAVFALWVTKTLP